MAGFTADFAALRRNMVDCQLRTYDVTNRRLLGAMDRVPRELFVPEARRALAYLDQPAALDGGRFLLAPMLTGRMLQALDLQPGQRFLDYAGGSGYTAAVAAELGAEAMTFDAAPGMAEMAEAALMAAQSPATVARALPAFALDAILVNGAAAESPRALLALLADGGKLAVVEPNGRAGSVMLYQRTGDVMGKRAVLDAAAPVLEEFRPRPAFAL
jgi:protein-L-isoaspartate(D-aspartate) O-methyltransferase